MSVIYETRISSRCVQIEDYGLTHFRFEALLFTAFSGAYYSITILGLEVKAKRWSFLMFNKAMGASKHIFKGEDITGYCLVSVYTTTREK